MRKIKIIAVPAGFAPEGIRNQWVGLELPVSPLNSMPEVLTRVTPSDGENDEGWVVSTAEAVLVLRKAGKEDAANFWGYYNYPGSVLIFGRQFCQEVPN